MATGTFEHATLQDLVDQLAQDVSDTGKTFYTSAELQRAVVEALRLSNALTARSRYTISFSATAGTAWYDLSTLAPAALGYTVTDRTTIENMQYRLMETVEPAAGAGMKEQFIFTELLRTLQQVRDRFLVDTECTVTRRAAQTNIEPDGYVEFDDAVAKVLRAVWIDPMGRRTVLRNSTDEASMTAKRLERRTSFATPKRWSVVGRPQLTLQLDPIPDLAAPEPSIQLTTIETGSTLSTTANSGAGTVLGIPDDHAAGVMWDALELLLSKHGMGHDPMRARAAAQLGALNRAVARQLPTVLQVAVNGVDVRVGQVEYLDAKNANWEGATRGIPRRAAVMGDWLALYPVPDDSVSVEVVVVSKLTEPALTDYVQIGREHLSGILAWARQILLFKVGGQPFQSAFDTAGLLIEQARAFNEERVRSCQYLVEFMSTGLGEPVTMPRSAPPPDLSGDPRDEASSHNQRQRDSAYRPYHRPIGGR
jgi:hypothetical protein